MGHFSGTETYWDGYSAWPFFIPKEPHQSQQRTRKVAYFFTLKRTKTGRRNGLLPKPNWTTYIRSDTIAAGTGNVNGKCSSGTSIPTKQLPDDPVRIARQCNFGQDQLAKVNDLAEEDHNKTDQDTGRPAFYDNAIPTEYEHSIGVRKGPMK